MALGVGSIGTPTARFIASGFLASNFPKSIANYLTGFAPTSF